VTTPLIADVAVVGGGPAGAAAAVTMAQAGLQVTVVDKATFPRDKFCGDGLTAGALRLLEALGLDPADVPSWTWVDDIVVSSPSHRAVCFPLPREQGRFAAVARRSELDAAVLDLARAAGAKVLDGHAVVGAHQHSDRVVLQVEGVGEVHARYAVGADGMWSPLRKHLGDPHPEGYRGEWHAFRQYVTGVTGRAATDLYVWFEPDLLPGYAWSFPLVDADGSRGIVNVGFGVHRGGKVPIPAMKDLWPQLLERPHIQAALGPGVHAEGPHRAWPIPGRVDQASLAHGRALWVGDAVGACDVMTGEGIGQALLTGRLAAEAIVATGPTEAWRARCRYEAAVRSELVLDHQLSLLLVRAIKHRKGARAAVRVAGLTDWTRRNFARWLFEDYPRAVLATPRRWRPRVLVGPGAYRGT